MELLKLVCIVIMGVMLLSGCGKPQSTVETMAVTAPVAVLQEQQESAKKNMPSENEEVERTLLLFAAAYFSGDRAQMAQYLVSDYGELVGIYHLPNQPPVDQKVQLPQSVTAELAMNGSCRASVAFREHLEADSYTYLSVELIQEAGQWKIRSYGLEK